MTRSDISRRLAMAGIAAASATPAWAQTRAKPRALALVGDRYHNPDYIRVSLDKVFHELDIAIDYTTKRASVSSLSPPTASGAWPGVHTRNLEVVDIEPLRAEIVAFVEAVRDGTPPAVSGRDGRNALALALRALERIEEHTSKVQVKT